MIDLEKREEYINLYDCYKDLLTNKQQAYFEDYFYDDLSLSEIASNKDVSRNAVFDQLKKTINLLYKYESILHLKKHYDKLNEVLDFDDINKIKNEIKSILKE